MDKNRKWNLQDIRPTEREKKAPPESVASHPKAQDMVVQRRLSRTQHSEPVESDVAQIDIVDGNSNRRRRIIIGSVVAIFILGGGFFVNLLMSGAKVTVNPNNRDVNVEAAFKAHKTPQTDELGYELLSLEAEGERQVKATGEEEVSERSTGTLFIYNASGPATQRLIKNTRFESPEGLIYRIEESVAVPGGTTDDSGKIVPGVITAKVFADGTGEQYNIAPARFTVPGLKGTDQYETVYAESTDDMRGGFEGKKFIIEESELQTAQQSLHTELRDALLEELATKKPAGFVLYDDSITFAYDSLPATSYGKQLATIKERARLQVPMFKESEFAAYIAEKTIAGYEGEEVEITDPGTLRFAYVDPQVVTADIAPLMDLEFRLSGHVQVVWLYDKAKLQSDLAGLPKTSLTTVLSGYPAIQKATAEVRPFWKQSFPSSPEEIIINQVIEKKE